MNELRPMVEELTLLDDQRNQLEDRISQVSLLVKEQKKAALTANISFYQILFEVIPYALQLDVEIADHNEAREREMPVVQEVEVKVKELRQTIQSLNNQQMSLRASFRKMKEKVTEMDEKVRC